MVRRSILVSGVCVLGIVLLGACKKNIQDKEAVKQGVLNYLSKRGDLVAMDVAVADVSFRDNEANATVHFQAKGNNSPSAGMTMGYVLERKGNQWEVKGRAGAGASHGMPTSGAGETLPPGHPTVSPSEGGPTPSMPPGHPPVEPSAASPAGASLPPLPELPPGAGKKPESKK